MARGKGFSRFQLGGNKKDKRDNNRKTSFKEESRDESVSELFVGEKIQRTSYTLFSRTNVATESVQNIREEGRSNYNEKAVMSMDGLIRPISKSGSGGLPRYAIKTKEYENICLNNNSIAPQPPIEYTGATHYDLEINNDYLDPLTNPNQTVHGTQTGHDFDIVGRDSALPTGLGESISLPVDEYNGNYPYRDDYRFFGLRGPMVMQGWGYRIDGKPVPNKADEEVSAIVGVYTDEDLEDQFMDDWLKKSDTWPVGPIDLRWDNHRGVWVAPQQYRMIVAELTGKSGPNTWGGFQTSGDTLYSKSGDTIPKTTGNRITLYDKTECDNLETGGKVIAYYDTVDCQYWIIRACQSGNSEAGSALATYNYNCPNTMPSLVQSNTSSLVFGNGLLAELDGINVDVELDLQIHNAVSSVAATGLAEIANTGFVRKNKLNLGLGLTARESGTCGLMLETNFNATDLTGCYDYSSFPIASGEKIAAVGAGNGINCKYIESAIVGPYLVSGASIFSLDLKATNNNNIITGTFVVGRELRTLSDFDEVILGKGLNLYDSSQIEDAVGCPIGIGLDIRADSTGTFFGTEELSTDTGCINTFQFGNSLDVKILEQGTLAIDAGVSFAITSGDISGATYSSNVYTMNSGWVNLVEPNGANLLYHSPIQKVAAYNFTEATISGNKLCLLRRIGGKNYISQLPCDGTSITTLSAS